MPTPAFELEILVNKDSLSHSFLHSVSVYLTSTMGFLKEIDLKGVFSKPAEDFFAFHFISSTSHVKRA